MSSRRDYATATLLKDGRVLVAGGFEDRGLQVLSSAELYDPMTGTLSPTGSMASMRDWHSATLLPDGRVLIAGCGDDLTAELYDPSTGTFGTAGSMTARRCSHTATLLSDGRVLLAGGLSEGHYLATAEIYDPATGKFTSTGSMKVGRENATATPLPDGRVLIVGGDQGDSGDNEVMLASAEIYDPKVAKFSSTGSMHVGRTHFTTTLLADGKVLVAGGQNYAETETSMWASAEIYDPATGKFMYTGSMSVPRADHTANLLPDGRVLIAFDTAELYDPATGKFSPGGSLVGVLGKMPAVTLLDGRVLFPGAPSALYWP